MKLDLAQTNYDKFDWISRMSLSFALHEGYLAQDNGNEIEVILHNVYDSETRIVIRDYKYNDAVVLYSAISNDTDNFLTEIINKKLISGIFSVVNMDAGIGIKAIWLAKYLKTVSIVAIESNSKNFRQLKKNITLNNDIVSSITPYDKFDRRLFDLKSLDLLVCSYKEISELEQNDDLLHLFSIASIIVASEFQNTDAQNDFVNYLGKYSLEYKHFDQDTILWRM